MSSCKRKPDSSKYALDYLRRGMSCVPVPIGKKAPVLKEWQHLRLMEDDAVRYFGETTNVGILTGEPSEGLVDVDLDVPEAERIADVFLPSTVTSGRTKDPCSHRWYMSPGSKTQKWTDIGGKMLLELRSTGCQTLVEPSVHPSGDRYVWDRSSGSDMTSIAPSDLVRACKELATSTIIARHLPPGGRHDYAMALAGYLLRRGRFDVDTTLKVLLAGWRAGGGDSKEAVKDIKGIVKDTR